MNSSTKGICYANLKTFYSLYRITIYRNKAPKTGIFHDGYMFIVHHELSLQGVNHHIVLSSVESVLTYSSVWVSWRFQGYKIRYRRRQRSYGYLKMEVDANFIFMCGKHVKNGKMTYLEMRD